VKASHSEVSKALDAAAPHVRLFLLYGPDEAGSAALAKRLERAMGPDAVRVDLESSVLKADHARLADEAASLSLFGDRQHVRIRPASEDCLPAIEALLALERSENPVIAIAGALKPSSALLKRALSDRAVLAYQSYMPDPGQAKAIAKAIASDLGLRLTSECAGLIAEAATNDRAVMTQELEKLALYLDAGPERPVDVTPDAVHAISAAVNDTALSALVGAVTGGRPNMAAAALIELGQSGSTAVGMLRALQKRVFQLVELQVDAASSRRSIEDVIEGRGKSIFHKDKGAIEREAKLWGPRQLARAAERLLLAERAVKSAANAGDVLAEAEMIRISRVAARNQ
jgi:DNA polymerase III subunit delta